MSGTDVLKVQENLIKLGYDLGRWGADGDFGRDTRATGQTMRKGFW